MHWEMMDWSYFGTTYFWVTTVISVVVSTIAVMLMDEED